MHYYRVSVTYPSGRSEDLVGKYNTLEDAINFGRGFLAEVEENEKVRNAGREANDEFLPLKKKCKAKFLVRQFDENKKMTIVYDSSK